MLKKFYIIIAILTIAFALTSNVFGQSSKGKTAKNTRITKRPSQATGGTIPVYKNGKTSVKNSDETPELNQRNAKPKDWVNKNPEAKPALLEFQIPEKIVSDNKHPEGQYSRKATDSRKSNPQPKRTTVKKPKGIIILDQDTQTVVAPRKRKRNK